jgi:hypothetical protein
MPGSGAGGAALERPSPAVDTRRMSRSSPPELDGAQRQPVTSSAITAFIDPHQIEELLAPFLATPADRGFVVRCILGEGPAHHRGTNYVLLRLLGAVVARHGARLRVASDSDGVEVPIRLPPRVAHDHDDDAYPLRFPRRVLERLAAPGSVTLDAMIDCVTDGPPQHSLANAAMLCLLDALLADDEQARR